MMSPLHKLISQCLDLNIRFELAQDKIRVAGNKAALTPALLQDIKAQKPQLLAWLKAQKRQPSNGHQRIPRRANLATPVPVSLAQQRVWLAEQFNDQSSQYNISGAIKLDGQLNLDGVQYALDGILQRHSIFRSVYSCNDEQTYMHIQEVASLPLPVMDLKENGSLPSKQQIKRVISKLANEPFDLTQDLSLRCHLLKLSDDSHILLSVMHHIASDALSLGVFTQEFTALYKTYVEGQQQGTPLASPLPPLEIEYADFAVWQREFYAEDKLTQEVAYWEEQLKDIPVVHELPLDNPRSKQPNHEGHVLVQDIPNSLLDKLQQLANQQEVTLFMLLETCFALLISRFSGQDDVVLGTPIAGRAQKQLAPLIGFFINNVALRTRFSNDCSFLNLLQQNKQTILQAFKHQQVPFDALVPKLVEERQDSFAPVFQIVFGLQQFSDGQGSESPEFALPGLRLSHVDASQTQVKHDLELTVFTQPNGLLLNWSYATALFSFDTIARLSRSFQCLLEAVVETPQALISVLPIISETDHAFLQELNCNLHDYPRQATVMELIRKQSELSPQRIALSYVDADGGANVQLTYAEMQNKIDLLSNYLIDEGVEPQQRVGVFIDASAHLAIAVLAIAQAGAVYVPLDPQAPEERLNFILKDAGIEQVICVSDMLAKRPLPQTDVLLIDDMLDDDWLEEYAEDTLHLEVNVTEQDLLYVLYTSGSTGQPKGVKVPHHSVMNYLCHALESYMEPEFKGAVMSSPLSFDATVTTFLTPLLAGKQLVILNQEQENLYQQLCHYLFNDDGQWLFKLTPAHLDWLAQADLSNSARHKIILGGEQLTVATLTPWKRDFLPSSVFVNEYGPTETVVGCCTYTVEQLADIPEGKVAIPIGKPIQNTQFYVISEEKLAPVGAIGELLISGEGVTNGYLNRVELTREKFGSAMSGVTGLRFYRTGDKVRYLVDGNLEFIGRIDEQVKIRGFRIELGEIESLLLADPRVLQAKVLVSGSGNDKQLRAFVVSSQQQTSLFEQAAEQISQQLIEQLQASLPPVMVPGSIKLLCELPLTANGKVDSKALLQLSSAPTTAKLMEPQTPTQQQMLDLWQQLLPAESLNLTDSFFRQGGHSLLAMRLISAISKSFDVTLTLAQLYEHISIEKLAGFVESRKDSGITGIARVDRSKVKRISIHQNGLDDDTPLLPLSFSQQRLWFIDQLGKGSAHYNMPISYRIKGNLNTEALQRVFNTLFSRHEILRTVYVMCEEEVYQRVLPDESTPLLIVDLTHLDDQAMQQKITEFLKSEAETPFDLSSDRMMRPRLLKLSEQEHLLTLTTHHIASDGWSEEVLATEFEQLYRAYADGQGNPLPPMAIQYADYAAWQRSDINQKKLEHDLQFWKAHHASSPTLHALPLDKKRPAKQQFDGAQFSRLLSLEVVAQLDEFARSHDTTLFVILHSAFALLLSKWSREQDVVIGVPVAGRNHPDVDSLIGFFVNSIALHSSIDSELSFQQLVQQHKDMTESAFRHQDVPFDKLVEHLNVPRSSSYTPLFQIMFSLQNQAMKNPQFSALQKQVADLVFESNWDGNVGSKFDLELMSTLDERGLWLNWNYATSLFNAQTIESLALSFECLLAQLVESPEKPVGALQWLAPADFQQQKQLAVGPTTTSPKRHIIDNFSAVAAAHSQSVAVCDSHGQMSFAQLDQRSNQIAHWLAQQDIGPGSIVALAMPPSITQVCGVLGILKAGAAYLPLDTSLPEARLQYIVQDSNAQLILTDTKSSEIVNVLPGVKACIDHETLFADLPTTACQTQLSLQDICYVIYTSGTTGNPKGVNVLHQGLSNYLEHVADQYLTDDIYGSVMSSTLSFDATVTTLFGALLVGKPLHILDLSDASALASQLEQYLFHDGRSWLFKLTPAHLQWLRECGASSSTRHTIVLGGEQLTCNGLLPWKQTLLPQTVFVNEYGPTETVVGCCVHFVRTLQDIDVNRDVVAIGKPIQNTRLWLLDSHNPVPYGCIGELYIGGEGVARGYLNREALTQEKFVSLNIGQDLSQTHATATERLYRTGDLVRYREDGSLEYLGRTDDQVKIRGFRIELGEVESALERNESVKQACVLLAGNGPDKRLVAYLALTNLQPELADTESSESNTVREVQQWLRTQLADYMIPAQFVSVENFPLTQNGKVDKAALVTLGQALSQTLEMDSPESLEEANVQQGLEQQLSDIWCELLQKDRVSRNANFFEIGGNSVLSMQLKNRIEKVTGCSLELTDLFEFPTIKRLAAHLQGGSGTDDSQAATPKTVDSTTSRKQTSEASKSDQDIAIIGMGIRFPDADNLSAFWDNLRSGRESLQTFAEQELLDAGVDKATIENPRYVKSGVLLDDIDKFDADYFSMTPREAEILDPQQRLLFECAVEALEQAGYGDDAQARDVGVFVGTAESSYLVQNLMSNDSLMRNMGLQVMHANSSAYSATRLSYKLNLKGPSVNVVTACSTSLVAVHQACSSLRLGEADMMLAGGAGVALLSKQGHWYEEGGIVSADGHCRAFSKDAGGTRAGNGAGLVVLKRLKDAIRDNDTIYSVIKGTALNNDGALKVGFTAPSIQGQSEVIENALTQAGVSSDSIGYVETHGTGTPLGDPIEVKALSRAFDTEKQQFCALGTLKPNIGHLDTAAGVAGLIKASLAVKNGELPPCINVGETNPKIEFGKTPFYLNTELRNWPQTQYPRRAGVSSFGIGGTNAHVVLEQAPTINNGQVKVKIKSDAPDKQKPQLLTLSAKTPEALASLKLRMADHLEAAPETSLADIAYTLHVGRAAHKHRYSMVTQPDLASTLKKLRAHSNHGNEAQDDPRLVFMFPGQGSQYLNMAKDLLADEPYFAEVFDRCCQLFNQHLQQDLHSVIYPESDTSTDSKNSNLDLKDFDLKDFHLNSTQWAQPAIFSVEYSLAMLLKHWGVQPEILVGHSIGEYVAACVAGVFSLEDSIKIVSARARLMQSTAPGNMFSVRGQSETVSALISGVAEIAAVNSPQHCVVSVSQSNTQQLNQILDNSGVEYRPIATSHAFHSVLMEPILESFKAELEAVNFTAPECLVYSNLTGKPASGDDLVTPQYWVDHLRQTVQFSQSIQHLLDTTEQSVLLEVGAGIGLSTLARKHQAQGNVRIVSTMRHVQQDVPDEQVLWQAVGELWCAGIAPDWQQVHEGQPCGRVPLPTYPFQRQRYWIESKGNKPAAVKSTKQSLDNWFYAPTWQRKPILMAQQSTTSEPETWLLISQNTSLLESLANAPGWEPQHILPVVLQDLASAPGATEHSHYSVRKGVKEDYQQLYKTLADKGQKVHRIIDLSTLELPETLTCLEPGRDEHLQHELHSVEQQACSIGNSQINHLLNLVQVFSDAATELCVLTQGAGSVLGYEATSPLAALVSGFCKVVPQEYPTLAVRQIDLDAPDPQQSQMPANELAQTLRRELLSASDEAFVAIRHGQRWLQKFSKETPLPEVQTAAQIDSLSNSVQLREKGVYLITGGLGQIGLTLANYMAQQAPGAKLILTTTSPFPEPQEWQTMLADDTVKNSPLGEKIESVQALCEAGAEVLVRQADVSSVSQMQQVMLDIDKQFNQLHGVIHCAGKVHGSMQGIGELTAEDVAAQFNAKVQGTLVLARILQNRPLDFCMMMSSLSSVLGGLGFAAYAAANAFLDTFVQQQHQLGNHHWLAVNWDGWHFNEPAGAGSFMDRFSMSANEGARAFARALTFVGTPQVVVSVSDLQLRLAQWVNNAANKGNASGTGKSELANKDTIDIANSGNAAHQAEHSLTLLWQEILGVENIQPDDHFFSIGGDSLLATRLVSMIREAFSVSEDVFSIRDFFAQPTIEEIAEKLQEAKTDSMLNRKKAELLQDVEELEEGVL